MTELTVAQVVDDLRSILFRIPEYLAQYEEIAIKSATNLIQTQAAQIAESVALRAELKGAYAGAAALRKVIEDAPHGRDGDGQQCPSEYDLRPMSKCRCWKAGLPE